MKVAIVGTSKLTCEEEKRISKSLNEIRSIISFLDTEIITGDAKGVDSLVKIYFEKLGYNVKVYEAKEKKWDSENGFKDRNIRIAKDADYIFSITTHIKNEKCYHCNENHQRTGGCYVLKYGRFIGKKGEVIIV